MYVECQITFFYRWYGTVHVHYITVILSYWFVSFEIHLALAHTAVQSYWVPLWQYSFYLMNTHLLLRSMNIHWASKETYNFLEWYPLKSTASKWMIFGLMLATVLLITHVKKQRNRMCQKWDKCLQITTSPISKSQKLLPFHRADFRTLQ